MTYKESWEEMGSWLERGKEYLEERKQYLSEKDDDYSMSEHERICGKLEGIKLCIEHMKESEKIYDLKEEEE